MLSKVFLQFSLHGLNFYVHKIHLIYSRWDFIYNSLISLCNFPTVHLTQNTKLINFITLDYTSSHISETIYLQLGFVENAHVLFWFLFGLNSPLLGIISYSIEVCSWPQQFLRIVFRSNHHVWYTFWYLTLNYIEYITMLNRHSARKLKVELLNLLLEGLIFNELSCVITVASELVANIQVVLVSVSTKCRRRKAKVVILSYAIKR